MNKALRAKRGFTLVELLVVIAIIGILAGFILSSVSGVQRRAKIKRAENALRQVGIELVAYQTDHGTLPPTYGYLSKQTFNDLPDSAARLALDPTDATEAQYFVLESYMNAIGKHKVLELYDEFGLLTSDTDYDGITEDLEYYPVDGKDALLNTSTANIDGQRPFIYIPINKRQFRKVKEEWDLNGGFPNVPNTVLQGLDFPPPSYDAFALISVGVVSNTQGLIYHFGPSPDDLQATDYPGRENYHYHIAGMATYYMLTRDIDNDGQRDFDHNARLSGGQGTIPYPPTKTGPGIDGPIYRVQE